LLLLLLFLLEENSLENKPFVEDDFCSFSEMTCLLLFTFRVGARKKERGTRERNVSESASAFARGFDREQRERERVVLWSPICFPPRGEPKLSIYKMRGGQEKVKSEILFLSKIAHHLLALLLFFQKRAMTKKSSLCVCM